MTRTALLSSAAIALSFAALPAVAQTSAPGLTYQGEFGFSYEYQEIDAGGGATNDDTVLSYLDFTAEYTFGTDGQFGVGIDYEGTVDLNETEEPLDILLVYGFFDLGAGRIAVGHVESAIEMFSTDNLISVAASRRNNGFITASNSLTRFFYQDNQEVYGISYTADYGDLEVAAAYQYTDDFDGISPGVSLNTYSLAARYRVNDQVAVYGGLEVYDGLEALVGPTANEAGFLVGVEGTVGAFTGELRYSRDLGFIGLLAGDVDQVFALGNYTIDDHWSVEASLSSLTTPVVDLYSYSVGGRYAFDNGFGIDASYQVIEQDFGGMTFRSNTFALATNFRF